MQRLVGPGGCRAAVRGGPIAGTAAAAVSCGEALERLASKRQAGQSAAGAAAASKEKVRSPRPRGAGTFGILGLAVLAGGARRMGTRPGVRYRHCSSPCGKYHEQLPQNELRLCRLFRPGSEVGRKRSPRLAQSSPMQYSARSPRSSRSRPTSAADALKLSSSRFTARVRGSFSPWLRTCVTPSRLVT